MRNEKWQPANDEYTWGDMEKMEILEKGREVHKSEEGCSYIRLGMSVLINFAFS